MRTAIIALVVGYPNRDRKENPQLVEVLSDDREIRILEQSLTQGDPKPLSRVHEHREQVCKQEDEFADYVEDLLCKPFQKQELQDHGLQWMRSRIKIEQYQRSEADAARIIADYAFQVFMSDPEKTDFFLAGASARVRVRVFETAQVALEASSEGTPTGISGSSAA